MPVEKRPMGAPSVNTAYRSIDCQIGTHNLCGEVGSQRATSDLPVIREACTCGCHRLTTGPAQNRAEGDQD